MRRGRFGSDMTDVCMRTAIYILCNLTPCALKPVRHGAVRLKILESSI
jgi:hypothetical protein